MRFPPHTELTTPSSHNEPGHTFGFFVSQTPGVERDRAYPGCALLDMETVANVNDNLRLSLMVQGEILRDVAASGKKFSEDLTDANQHIKEG